jgi:phosphatidylinositol 4-kinase B
MGSIALPVLLGLSAEIARRQARRERVFEEEAEAPPPLHRSRSMSVKPTDDTSLTTKDSMIRATTSASFDVRRFAGHEASVVPHGQRSSSATHFSHRHSAFMSRSSPNLEPPLPILHRPSPHRTISPSTFTDENISRTLQTHYYSTQTQFLQCLQDISLRLRLVPRAARQSALRLELGGLDKWLPADVCLANICQSSHAHDRIVQIVESECTILNSAERV